MNDRPIEHDFARSTDPSGNPIICVYAKNVPDYVVYRDPMRVMIIFADDPQKARKQRASISALNPLRGQIAGLIDGWHIQKKWEARAKRYDRRVADAIIVGLEGGVADALPLLTEIREDIIAERKSLAQTDYLLCAAGTGLFLALLIWVLAQPAMSGLGLPQFNTIYWGSIGGILGAFFSVATGLRGRTILVDLQNSDNLRDAVLRITVGTIGGFILICLLLSGQVKLAGIDAQLLTDPTNSARTVTALVLGFMAGFSERAIPDILEQASLATRDETKSDVAGEQAKAAASPTVQAAAAALADQSDEADVDLSIDAELDECLCDSPPVEGEEITDDADLPVAVGGVSPDVPAPDIGPASPGTGASTGRLAASMKQKAPARKELPNNKS